MPHFADDFTNGVAGWPGDDYRSVVRSHTSPYANVAPTAASPRSFSRSSRTADPTRGTRRVGERTGRPVQPVGLRVEMEGPAGVAVEPLAEFGGMGAVLDLPRLTAPLVAARTAQLRADAQRFGIRPRCGGRDRVGVASVEGVAVDRQMPGGVQPEGRPPQPVTGVIAGRLGEPAGERTEVRRTVGAPGPPLVERAYHREKLRDGAQRTAPQQLSLGLPPVAGDEPGRESLPPRRPDEVRLLLGTLGLLRPR